MTAFDLHKNQVKSNVKPTPKFLNKCNIPCYLLPSKSNFNLKVQSNVQKKCYQIIYKDPHTVTHTHKRNKVLPIIINVHYKMQNYK